jgi:hypothetical protein
VTRPAMRTPARVPGFATQNEPTPADATCPAASSPTASLSTRAGTRQLNLRLLLPLHERYRRLVRECDDVGIDTSMTEVIHALLYGGPTDLDGTRQLIRAWRRARDGDV